LKAARNSPGVKQISIVCGTSEQITDIVDSGSRIGFVIAQGENASEAIAVAEKALACVKIDIKS
jgi:phosphoribosylamine-glycine ligase